MGSSPVQSRRLGDDDGRNVRSVVIAAGAAPEHRVTEGSSLDFGVNAALPRIAHGNRALVDRTPSAPNHRRAHGQAPRRCLSNTELSNEGSGGTCMATIIESLDNVSLEEALAYLDSAEGDELEAAFALAEDRNLLDGSDDEPDEAEVHHALFLLRRARGLTAPSFDLMRIQIRERVAA